MIHQVVRKNRVPVSVGIPLDLLNIIDENVVERNCKSRSDLIVEVLKEKFQPVKK